ncbi:MAG: universal stress protein [Planctomycetes bacterium]|nr:universal stress protein [Planctomycetota bacterium]MBI3847775.1 universal stress protein [Planctomycetota bacterium]
MELDFKTVLAPTDFSEASDKAIPFAFRLAKDHGAAVLLVHVVDALPMPSPLYAHYYAVPSPEQIVAIEKQSEEALRSRIPAEYRGTVRADVAVVHGEASQEILRLSVERHASVIVIATHGRTGLKHLLLGSVAEKVVRHATCPVFVVR